MVKHKLDDTSDQIKERLMEKGQIRTYDINYEKTFAPVVKMNNVCILLSFAAPL